MKEGLVRARVTLRVSGMSLPTVMGKVSTILGQRTGKPPLILVQRREWHSVIIKQLTARAAALGTSCTL